MATDRVTAVLDVLDGRVGTSLATVVRASGVPRSSAHRILTRLVELGWIERHESGYRLGLRTFGLGSRVIRDDGLRQRAAPVLAHLHRSTGLAAHLGVLDGGDVVLLEQVASGKHALDWSPGTRVALAESAPGWALVAATTTPGEALAPSVAEEVANARRRGGVAVQRGAGPSGVLVASLCVGDVPGAPPAVLSVSGPASDVRVEATVRVLRLAARDIGSGPAAAVSGRRGASVSVRPAFRPAPSPGTRAAV